MGPARGARREPRPGAPLLAGTEGRHQQPWAHRAQPTLRTGTGRKHGSEQEGRRPHSAADGAVVRAQPAVRSWGSPADMGLRSRCIAEAEPRGESCPAAGKGGLARCAGSARRQAPSVRPHPGPSWRGTRKRQLPCHAPSARTTLSTPAPQTHLTPCVVHPPGAGCTPPWTPRCRHAPARPVPTASLVSRWSLCALSKCPASSQACGPHRPLLTQHSLVLCSHLPPRL